MHIAQGVLRAINVNKLTSTGCLFKFWVADWFAQLNNKMDGDLKKIRMVGQYMIEIWKAIGTYCTVHVRVMSLFVCQCVSVCIFSSLGRHLPAFKMLIVNLIWAVHFWTRVHHRTVILIIINKTVLLLRLCRHEHAECSFPVGL